MGFCSIEQKTRKIHLETTVYFLFFLFFRVLLDNIFYLFYAIFTCFLKAVLKNNHINIKCQTNLEERRCLFCRKEEDDPEHILIQCPPIWDLWANLISVLGVCWTCPYQVKDLIRSWGQFRVKKNVRRLWWATPLSIFGLFFLQ